MNENECILIILMYYIDFVNIKYFSILSLNYLKSFETKCFLLIFLNWVKYNFY